MKPSASRYLLFAAFSVVLAACQSKPVEEAHAPAAPDTFEQLQQNITGNELATAEDQLATLQAKSPDDPRLEQLQRQLAEAYLSRSQVALQKGDVDGATTAIIRARTLMPKAPALTNGVNGAIATARKAELEKAEAELKAAEARRTAKVIDPAKDSTTVLLKTTDSRQLRRQLNDIAADAVAFNCEVTVQVPRTDDYPWLSTLLAKRVVKINPDADVALKRVIARDQPAQVILRPARNN